jgi:hypothetical protein
MLLEILNVSKEVYVCLYAILPLAAFTQVLPTLVRPYQEQIISVLRKILNVPGGLEESCLMYVGQWILALVQQGLI